MLLERILANEQRSFLPEKCQLKKSDFRPILGLKDYERRTEQFTNKKYSDNNRPLVNSVTNRSFLLLGYNTLIVLPLALPIIYLVSQYFK